MDPVTAAGIALSVVGLFPLCAQGFTIIQDGFKANKGDVSEALTMIYIHSGTFTAWGEWWGIGPSAQPRTAGQKTHLQKYIESSKTVGPAVKATLIAISNKFADVQGLEKSYGIKIRGEDIEVSQDIGDLDVETVVKGEIRTNSPGELKKRAKHMNILKRAKFVLKDRKGLEKLSVQLSQYIDALMKMCSEHAAERVEQAMLSQVLAERNLTQDLRNVVAVAKQESARKRDDDQRYATYDLLASTAAFKAKIRDADPDVYLNQEDYRYWETGRDWDYNNRGGTVAVHGKDDLVCYIEWKYYRIMNGEDNANDIKDIEKLAHMLSDEDKPAELRTLTCFGIFKDSIHPRYGLVYQPPKYIEEPPRGWQSGAISKLRKPVSLFQLLRNSISQSEATNVLDLGVRFQLAKQLVQSTYLLHAAGWVHKNIRSASVLFLPSESRLGGPSTTGQKDFGRPWLSGFGHSRWEDPVNDPGHSYYGIPDSAGGYQSLMRTQQMASINLDFYHHPDKRNNPLLRYRPSHDVYSLGCVLLEIGLWQDLDSFHKFYYTPDKFRAVLLDLTNDLVGQTGSKYAAAVRECLTIDSTDRVTSGKEALHILCWKVSAMLDGCSA